MDYEQICMYLSTIEIVKYFMNKSLTHFLKHLQRRKVYQNMSVH
jgi:hypothetical protein